MNYLMHSSSNSMTQQLDWRYAGLPENNRLPQCEIYSRLSFMGYRLQFQPICSWCLVL